MASDVTADIDPANAEDGGYPSPAYAWGTIALLTLAYVSSFIDRYIFGLLTPQIKADLALTDTQLGMISGLAFAIFYATSAVFLGWLADHKRRTWIVGIGITIWSISTVACGLAKNYIQMFLARVGVGAGEATLSPCAMSMIADSFPREKRGAPIAVYTSALVIGAGVANLASAGVIEWTKSTASVAVPLFGDLAPWQLAFLIVGLPGLLIAIPFMFWKEPKRRDDDGNVATISGGNPVDTMSFLTKNWAPFFAVTAIVCTMTITAYAQGQWMPSTFERTWGWSTQLYGLVNGIVILAVSPATILFMGRFCDYLSGKGIQDAPYRILMLGLLIMTPTNILAPLMPDPRIAFAMLAINTVGIGTISAVGVTALLPLCPPNIRAQIVAVYYMMISMAGLLIGPIGVGWLSDNVFGEENLRYAMALLPALFAVPMLALMFPGRGVYRRAIGAVPVDGMKT